MKETEQTLLDQIKNKVAIEKGYDDWETMENWYIDHNFPSNIAVLLTGSWKLVCERYATAKAKASCEATLKNASEKAVVRGYCAGCERAGLLHCAHADSCGSNVVIVDKSSINHPSNIVIV